MKLPNAEQATVPEEKTTGYLLSAEHEHGRAKHGFFTRFGFTVDEWDVLRSALLRHAAEHEVATVTEMRGGTAYAVDGPLAAPDGRTPLVRTDWFIDVGATNARFITPYPLRRRMR